MTVTLTTSVCGSEMVAVTSFEMPFQTARDLTVRVWTSQNKECNCPAGSTTMRSTIFLEQALTGLESAESAADPTNGIGQFFANLGDGVRRGHPSNRGWTHEVPETTFLTFLREGGLLEAYLANEAHGRKVAEICASRK